ncbi:hypothetical protein ACFONL_09550 [Camelimonas fluminis]|uniref:Secreted protein n=1 Tax=Camelimonas fluminis TaxID=1576911 RepID=A0ABV7UHT4_9HYPH|nr:hypothetical protein [Camelimonas fluminis]
MPRFASWALSLVFGFSNNSTQFSHGTSVIFIGSKFSRSFDGITFSALATEYAGDMPNVVLSIEMDCLTTPKFFGRHACGAPDAGSLARTDFRACPW